MPQWLQSLILGIVQGITEFVPVSSSGHLVLVPYLAGWESPGLAFDVALHMGTAAAVIVYFRRELVGMGAALLGRGDEAERLLYRRLFGLLVIATIPVAIAGLTLEDFFERVFTSPLVVSAFLLVTAAVLTLGERVRDSRVRASAPAASGAVADDRRVWQGDWMGEVSDEPGESTDDVETGWDPADPAGKDLGRIGLREALVVGLAQSLALFPGMSRSGSTITAGLLVGLSRPAAARFSFLLSLPALLGAAVVSLPELDEARVYGTTEIALGVLAAFIAGYVAIAWLIRLLASERLTVFVRYLVAAAVVGALGYLMNGPIGSV
jgi:undecaprenyl-diphosphatase